MANQSVLANLLRVLVAEWGIAKVQAALSDIQYQHHNVKQTDVYQVKIGKKSSRPNATQQVLRSDIGDDQRDTLLEIANKFDAKTFLPTVSDVKDFLLMMGKPQKQLKDRSEAFRSLYDAILALPPERLQQVVVKARHAGPSQLGPLSDAISASAKNINRRKESGPENLPDDQINKNITR